MDPTKTVRVELGERSYDVRVGEGLLDALGETAAAVGDVGRVVIISDSTVTELYRQPVADSLEAAGLDATLIHFPPGEPNKTLVTVGRIFERLFAIQPPIDRSCLIVALGGGVPGDVGGFVAATALRGLRWMQCPTTLLADVDSSVGGKTGVDAPAGKNLIGSFHQPLAVLIDILTLRTLPERELRSGLVECVKHALIRDASLLGFIAENTGPILACDPGVMTELIARNVAIKASVVSTDERESGVRAHLNFGHTIGHGIETFAGYAGITHGEAVALGMVAACQIAAGKGMVDAGVREALESVLDRLGIPIRRRGLDAEGIWRIMQHDKKARGGKVRFILPTALGEVDIFDDVTAEEAKDAIGLLK